MSKKVFDDPTQQLFKPRGRILFLKYFVLVFFVILGVRFWYLQVVQHDYYVRQAENNRVRDIPIPASRGAILDREGRVLVDSTPSYVVMLYQEDMTDREKTLDVLVSKLSADRETVLKQMSMPGSRSRPVAVKTNATPADRAWIEAHEYEHPELKVELQPQRVYPLGEVLAHVLGYISEINEDELREPEFDNCRPGNIIGKSGIERSHNKILMGKEGSKRVIVDSRGRIIEELGIIPPIPGQDVITTIDLDIQMVAEEALNASGLNGTVVINDPRDGGILAMVSHPSFDPSLFARGIKASDFAKLVTDPKKPLRNRAIQDRHPAGSTWKIIMAAASMEAGALNEKSTLVCGGGISIGSRFAQCLGSHGAPDIQRAIEVSCNGFFYRAGLKLGIDNLEKFDKQVGLGMKSGIDLPNEDKGNAPSRAWKRREYPNDPKWRDGDTINAAIGQSGVAPTPLQMMHAITGIGNHGKFYTPHILKEGRKSEYHKQIAYEPKLNDINMSEATWKTVSQGMWRVVNASGTARRAMIEGFDVCGKTGTAQVVSVKTGATGAQKEHAWFVGYAPKAAPEVGGVAFVENGGHGGVIAAPIIRACFLEYKRKRDGLPKQDLQLAQIRPEGVKPTNGAVAAKPPVDAALKPASQQSQPPPAAKPPKPPAVLQPAGAQSPPRRPSGQPQGTGN